MLYNVTDYTTTDFELSEDNLLYVDQLTADENGKISTSFLPKNIDESSTTLLVGDFGNGTETKVLTAHSYTSVEKKATCLEDGFTTYTCMICGDYYTDDFVEATGHKFGVWEIVTVATMTEDGIKKRTCSYCDEEETIRIPKTGITVTVTDADGNVIKEEVISGDMTEISFDDIADGEYTVTVSKETYATREYTVVATDGTASVEFKLNKTGDMNGDGKINAVDVARANAHAKGASALSGYDLACVDVNGDGKVNAIDVALINAHSKGTKALW